MESTPKNFVPGVFDPKDPQMANSGMNAAVPSQVNGLLTALEKYGTMDRKEVMATATEGKHTSHISVIDQYGNIVSPTTTLGNLFGCAIATDGMGFAFNSNMSNLEHDPAKSQIPDYVTPGKRVRTTISPTIVIKDGNPILAIGSPGSHAIPSAITLVTNNMLLYGMDVQEAIDFPRATETELGKPIIYAKQNSMTPEVRESLTQMGYTINPRSKFAKLRNSGNSNYTISAVSFFKKMRIGILYLITYGYD